MIGTTTLVVLLLAASAADPTTGDTAFKRNAIQADLGLAVVGLAYERFLTDRFAVQVSGHLFGTWFMNPYVAGFGGGVRPTWFFDDGGRGLYVAPFFRYERLYRYNGIDTEGQSWSAGAWAGWSWVFFDALNARVGVGAQYFTASAAGIPRFGTVLPAIDAVVGWMF